VAPLLEIRNLQVGFPAIGRMVTAVDDVSFSIAAAESLALVGESGSGKSVTALAIMRLLVPQARVGGTIRFEGQDLAVLDPEQMRRIRGSRIAMIFQEPMTALNPVMRVGDQIAEAILAHADAKQESGGVSSRARKRRAWERAVEALRVVAIAEPDRRARDYPHQLSGGMRQRVMIAMAVVNRPQMLIADEPTTALDVTVQAQILELLAELQQRFSLAMLFISHDLAVVSKVASRVAVMYAGRIVESAPAEQIFRNAIHPYTRGLLNSVPTLRTDRSRPLKTIEGTVPSPAALPPGCGFAPRCELRIESCDLDPPPLIEVAPGHWARCPVVAGQHWATAGRRD
jgi:peptide/nickel transport system ATP-binding protein